MFKNYLYIRQYEEHVHRILRILDEKTKRGISNYSAIADRWLESSGVSVDSEEKRMAYSICSLILRSRSCMVRLVRASQPS